MATPAPVAISFDIGTINFVYCIARPLPIPEQPIPPRQFPNALEILHWKKIKLEGKSVPEYNHSLVQVLDDEPLVADNLCERVYIEQQVAMCNPTCFAIASGVTMYFLMRKNLLDCQYPHTIFSVGPTSKFTFFLLKTPPGDAHRMDRKLLAVRIVEFLFADWVRDGAMDRKWMKLFRGQLQQHDHADCFLQMLVAEWKRVHYRPTWEALERLYDYLLKVPRFSKNGSWRLAMTVEGERHYQARAPAAPPAPTRKRKDKGKGKTPIRREDDSDSISISDLESSDDSAIREAKRMSRLEYIQQKEELNDEDLVMIGEGVALHGERVELQQELAGLVLERPQQQADEEDSDSDML